MNSKLIVQAQGNLINNGWSKITILHTHANILTSWRHLGWRLNMTYLVNIAVVVKISESGSGAATGCRTSTADKVAGSYTATNCWSRGRWPNVGRVWARDRSPRRARRLKTQEASGWGRTALRTTLCRCYKKCERKYRTSSLEVTGRPYEVTRLGERGWRIVITV